MLAIFVHNYFVRSSLPPMRDLRKEGGLSLGDFKEMLEYLKHGNAVSDEIVHSWTQVEEQKARIEQQSARIEQLERMLEVKSDEKAVLAQAPPTLQSGTHLGQTTHDET